MNNIGRGRARAERQEAKVARGWFGMEAPIMTPELKNSLRALQMRNYLDPKRFYKANDSSKLPKFFQIGTVVEGMGEYKSARLKRHERQQSFMDEILADKDAKRYTKRVFSEIQAVKQASGKRARPGSGKRKGR